MLPHLRNLYGCTLQKIKHIGPAAGNVKKRGMIFFKKWIEKFSIRRVIDSVSLAPLVAISAVIVTGMAVMLLYGLGFRLGYRVYIDGEYIASVPDKKVLYNSINTIDTVLGTDYNLDIEPETELAVVKPKEGDITDEIVETLDDVTEGVVLTVDGEAVTAFANSSDAEQTLDSVLEASRTEGAVSVEFVNEIELNETYVKTETVQDVSGVTELLTSYETEPEVYTLSEGENLETVSEKLQITKEELLNRNTAFTESDFRKGAKIITNRPKKVLSVKLQFETNITEEIPFETEKIDDPELYEGTTDLRKQGKTGIKEITCESVEIDGVRTQQIITDEIVRKRPVKQIELVGTKPKGEPTGIYEKPVTGIITSHFGYRWGCHHNGVDVGASAGTPIYAADGGTVISSGDAGDGYGLKVVIDHGNGNSTLYAHASEVCVTTGTRVEKGELIARVGSTGNSTGPHLHFELILNGIAVNPLEYVSI